jgi:RNA polymerase sigma-70 factor, ECF subfamily
MSRMVNIDEIEGPGTEVTDHSLISRFQSGQAEAATAIYLRYAKRLQQLVHKQKGADLGKIVDDEDIVQSVFRTFFRRAAAGQYQVPHGDELWKLFLVIALNKTKKLGAFHRAAKRDVRKTASLDHSHAEGQSPTDDSPLKILQLVITELLTQMPADNRKIVELRIEGYEVKEIADMTKRAKRSVERILQDFRDKLRSMIENQ